MQQEIFNVFNTFFDAGRQITDINTRAYQKLIQQQVALASVFADSGKKQIELAYNPQFISNYLNAQKDLTQEYADKVVNTMRESADIVAKTRDELKTCMEENVATAQDNVKKAQEAAVNTAKEVVDSAKNGQQSGKKAA